MLVLTGRRDDEIYLDCGVRLVVVDVFRSRVRFGIEAPPTIGILRGDPFHALDATVDSRFDMSAYHAARRLLSAPFAQPGPR